MAENSVKVCYEIVILGDKDVGKTALIFRYLKGTFHSTLPVSTSYGAESVVKTAERQSKHFKLLTRDTLWHVD